MPRIELLARQTVDGLDCWRNNVEEIVNRIII